MRSASNSQIGRDAISQQLPKLFELVKSYVSEMGVGDLFFQQMMNTDPAALIRYRNDEFKTLFPGTDPVYDEERIAYVARVYGLTTSEARRREQQSLELAPAAGILLVLFKSGLTAEMPFTGA
jgi:hypothetical protein